MSWTFVQLAQDIHFTLAARAWAGAAQFLQRNEALFAVIPPDGQFIADVLNVRRTHVQRLPDRAACANGHLREGAEGKISPRPL